MIESLWHLIKIILVVAVPGGLLAYVLVDYMEIKKIVIKYKIK